MPHLLAIAFDDLETADRVLLRLRELRDERLVDLEDAVVVQRDRRGRFHMKQAVAREGESRIPHSFWQRLLARLFHHAGEPDGAPPPEHGGLPRDFVERMAERLRPGTSALFVLVEPHRLDALVEAFEGTGGHLLQTDFEEPVRRELEAALAGRWVPPAEEVRELARRVLESRRSRSRDEARRVEEERRRRWIEELLHADLTPELIHEVRRTVLEAARRGAFRALVYRFPSEMLTDRGRRVIQQEPDWPETLVGQPRRFYEWYLRELAPRGYRLEARLLDWRDHLPGDVGFFLRWDTPEAAGHAAAEGGEAPRS